MTPEEQRRQDTKFRVVRWTHDGPGGLSLTWVAPLSEEQKTGYAEWARGRIVFPVGPDTYLCHLHPQHWAAQLPTLDAVWKNDQRQGYQHLGGGSPGMASVTEAEWNALVEESRPLREREVAARIAARDQRQARVLSLRTAAVPKEAVAAYVRYQGNADRAWENEDESAWSFIRSYAEAIEEQGLAREVSGRKFLRELNLAARENAIVGEA